MLDDPEGAVELRLELLRRSVRSADTSVEHLRFGYPGRPVFADLTLNLGGGAVGLLGPNGAGKSTLISLLATLKRPAAGRVQVLGHDVLTSAGRRAARSETGLLTQSFPLVGSLTVLDTVAYAAWTHGVPQRFAHPSAERALAHVGLSGFEGRRARALSGGERRRVGIACAIAHRPRLLILDEPTAGLDPLVRVELRRMLRLLAADTTILIATHLIEDAVQLCTRIVVLDGGRAVFEGSPAALEAVAEEDDRGREGSRFERGYEALITKAARRDAG